MKNRSTLVLFTGILVTYLSRIFIPIPNATPFQGIGLPLSSKNPYLGFDYVMCSMVVYGMLYSWMFPVYGEYDFMDGLGRSFIMASLVIGFSKMGFGFKKETYFSKAGKYLSQSLCVVILFDLITGVLIPIVSENLFLQAFTDNAAYLVIKSKFLELASGQVVFTLSYSLLSCVPIIFSPLIENFIVYGWRNQQVNLVSERS